MITAIEPSVREQMIAEEATRYCIPYLPIYADIVGSVSGAIFLQQLRYWTELNLKNPKRQGWFFMTNADWYAQTRLSAYEIRKNSKILEKIGLLERKQGKFDKTYWFRLNTVKLRKLIVKISTHAPSENFDLADEIFNGGGDENFDPRNENFDLADEIFDHKYKELILPPNISLSNINDENKNISFEVQSLETTPQLDTTEEAIPNSPLAKESEIETGDQGANTQSDGGGVFAPPCSKNVNSASHSDPLKQAHERRQAYRKKQQSGGFKDETLADKFSPLFVEQGKEWGKHPQEVFEGFESFILQKSKDKANPQGYAIAVIAKTVESFNQGKIGDQFLWKEYLKANKPAATEPDPIPYLSAINLFKTFYNSDMDFARQQIEDVCKGLGWTFERFVEYARTKGDLLDFSFN